MMNLEDVPDMNVGDMVNGHTSGVNVSYMIHVNDSVIPYMTRYYNLCTTVYYNLCQVFDALNLTIGLSD
jgi:hypothetical protein